MRTMKIVFFLTLLSLLMVSQVMVTQAGEQDVLDATFNKIVNDLNSKLPMMMNNETRLDNTNYYDRQLYYTHTLVNYKADEVGGDDIENLRSTVINGCCSNPRIRAFIQQGIRFNYIYYGKDGKHVTKITVGIDACSK